MACVRERAARHEALQQAAALQKLAERRQMAVHGDPRALVPPAFAVAAQRAYLFWRSPLDIRVSSDIFWSAVHAVLCLHFGRSHQDSMDFPVVQPPLHQTGEMRGLNKQFELNALQNTRSFNCFV